MEHAKVVRRQRSVRVRLAQLQGTLQPEWLDDYVVEENPARVVDVFVDELDLGALGFKSVDPAATGRPAYPSCISLKIYIYG